MSAFKSDAELDGGIDISQSHILSSAIFGACLPYIFGALTMMAVGRAASLMIREVLRQFDEYKLLTNPSQKPDYQRCVEISTQASIIEMTIPGVLAVCAPLFVGFLLGTEALGGMLIGSIISGFMLAVFMANAGGAWDNAKKFIEANGLGREFGKNSPAHKAAVVGDTIGDPFKDTAGPSLDILFKMMAMISLVFASIFSAETYDKNKWWIGVIVAVFFFIVAGGITYWMRSTGFGKTPHPVTVQSSIASMRSNLSVPSNTGVSNNSSSGNLKQNKNKDNTTNNNNSNNNNETGNTISIELHQKEAI